MANLLQSNTVENLLNLYLNYMLNSLNEFILFYSSIH